MIVFMIAQFDAEHTALNASHSPFHCCMSEMYPILKLDQVFDQVITR